MEILLDMDGVVSDFLSGALDAMNHRYGEDYTPEDYAKNFGKFGINEFYGVSVDDFWHTLSVDGYWDNLPAFDWSSRLYSYLKDVGDVTIVTSPSQDPSCAKEKLVWLKRHLGVNPSDVFIGSKKYLMAGNGILIDDWDHNVNKFIDAGGDAILVPSNWNTENLKYDDVVSVINDGFENILIKNKK